MYESESCEFKEILSLLPKDRNKCAYISDVIILQCLVVWGAAASVFYCVWNLDNAVLDFDKLIRIMYLYDPEACGYKLSLSKMIVNLHISNETYGLDVLPIKWLPAIVTVSTRLSAKTRKYMESSCVIHVFWFLLAIAFRVFIKNSTDTRTLKVTLAVFFYTCVFIVCYDLSMALVYVTHIKQSLTKGMILRYSGWSTELNLSGHDDFGGWLPMAASLCWLRGVLIFCLNVYFCKIINNLRRKIRTREVKKKYPNPQYQPIPESEQLRSIDDDVLVYRVGERKPHTRHSTIRMHF